VTKPPLRIAVVDDEEPVRKALMRLMRSVGLSVETVASGPDFLKYIETRLPDCIVLDLPSTKDEHHHMKLFSELSLRSSSEKDGERWKHQSKSQFPLAVATTAARITTTMSWIAMGMAGLGTKIRKQ
jgi:CheY-like chemotaxis protein